MKVFFKKSLVASLLLIVNIYALAQARIEPVQPGDLTPEQKKAAEDFFQSRKAPLTGPIFSIAS
jgi:4-carboxymuconolactone decarboxylase